MANLNRIIGDELDRKTKLTPQFIAAQVALLNFDVSASGAGRYLICVAVHESSDYSVVVTDDIATPEINIRDSATRKFEEHLKIIAKSMSV